VHRTLEWRAEQWRHSRELLIGSASSKKVTTKGSLSAMQLMAALETERQFAPAVPIEIQRAPAGISCHSRARTEA
jgi:hypothetical protein